MSWHAATQGASSSQYALTLLPIAESTLKYYEQGSHDCMSYSQAILCRDMSTSLTLTC
jgi:hypothetical protein